MKLVDLNPRWLLKDGKRVGFIFKSPKLDSGYLQSCFAVAMPKKEQFRLFHEALGDDEYRVQPCKPEFAWTIAGGIDAATFETMTVSPSLDGSAGGLWHGSIANGEIK
jgi:hypothetical protein